MGGFCYAGELDSVTQHAWVSLSIYMSLSMCCGSLWFGLEWKRECNMEENDATGW